MASAEEKFADIHQSLEGLSKTYKDAQVLVRTLTDDRQMSEEQRRSSEAEQASSLVRLENELQRLAVRASQLSFLMLRSQSGVREECHRLFSGSLVPKRPAEFYQVEKEDECTLEYDRLARHGHILLDTLLVRWDYLDRSTFFQLYSLSIEEVQIITDTSPKWAGFNLLNAAAKIRVDMGGKEPWDLKSAVSNFVGLLREHPAEDYNRQATPLHQAALHLKTSLLNVSKTHRIDLSDYSERGEIRKSHRLV